MRIGYDAKRLFHNFTGLGNYSRTLVRNLATHYPNLDIHLFTPSIPDHCETQWFLDQANITIHTARGQRNLWRSFGISQDIERLDLELYHGLSHELPLRRPRSATRMLVTFHDLIYEIYPKQFGLWDRNMYRYKYRRSAHMADHIIAISESTKNDLHLRYNVEPKRMTTVYQSCHPSFLAPPAPQKTERDYILYVGSIIPRKGLLQIAQAYTLLPSAARPSIRIIGGGGRYMEEVKNYIQQNGLTDHFHFLGKVPNTDLIDHYRHAKALLLPSIYEGFGIPVIEALSQETPVITSDVSSLPEALGPGGLRVDPHSPQAIADAIKHLVNHPEQSKIYGQEGRRHVLDRFSAKATSAALMNVYESLIAKRDQ